MGFKGLTEQLQKGFSIRFRDLQEGIRSFLRIERGLQRIFKALHDVSVSFRGP